MFRTFFRHLTHLFNFNDRTVRVSTVVASTTRGPLLFRRAIIAAGDAPSASARRPHAESGDADVDDDPPAGAAPCGRAVGAGAARLPARAGVPQAPSWLAAARQRGVGMPGWVPRRSCWRKAAVATVAPAHLDVGDADGGGGGGRPAAPMGPGGGEAASAECLLCYEERGSVEPAPCCGKGTCGRCRRMLERRAGSQPLLCPRPSAASRPSARTVPRWASAAASSGSSAASASRPAVGNSVGTRAWRVLTVVALAPRLPLALREAAEALLHVASVGGARQGPQPAGQRLAAAEVAVALCRQWPSTAEFLVQSLRNFWDDLDVAGSIRRPSAHRATVPGSWTGCVWDALSGSPLSTEQYWDPAALHAVPTARRRMMGDEVGSVLDYAEVLVLRSVLAAVDVFAILRLRHKATSAAQGSFACLLVRRLESALGRPRVMEEIFAEAVLEGCCAGMFPLEGHPADVAYLRELYEGAGLAWLCQHDSFSALAMLSDSE
ncbi:unnamed protein product [Prorocentrum cordatum]|uniref:E3 ubiquitin-protein ligase n=1 Tax=Prorocentrum cordatum TaxID=2364126 RepID=A0ABN9SR49_9DINO|nr:unnamed protein product [Polarella glacialis]